MNQQKVVYGEGYKDSKICLIGEAPGAEEERYGKPFVGYAGNLLNRLLATAGIIRSHCYITNVVKVRPPKNDISTFIKFKKKNVDVSEDYKKWEAILHEELKDCQANVYVPLGNVPLYALMKIFGINKWRGSILSSDGRKVIPTIHPAAALRQYLYIYPILSDLKRVLTESHTSNITTIQRYINTDPTLDDILDYVKELKEMKIAGFDIEVVKGELSMFSLAKSPVDAIVVPFTEKGSEKWCPDEEVIIMEAIAEVLEDKTISKWGQNLIFDYDFMYFKYGIKIKTIEDTMIGQAIIAPELPKDLGFITSIYCDGEPYYKDDSKQYLNFGESGEEAFRIYNGKDSLMCRHAFPKIERDIEKLGCEDVYRRHVDLIEPLIFMQSRGMNVDVEGLKAESKKMEKEIKELMEELHSVAGTKLNPHSPKQLIQYFYIDKKLSPYYKKGALTCDDKALKRLSIKGVEEAQIIREIRKRNKLKSTYLDVDLGSDKRYRCSFKPITANGRLSSGANIFGEGTNMQNLPPKIKKFLLCDNGFVLYNIDLPQAENRVVAYISPEPKMIEAFEKGIDIHKQTASFILKKPIKEISDEEGSSTIGDGSKSERYWGKTANYSLIYGMGPRKFSLDYEVTEKEAKWMISEFRSAYLGIPNYYRWIQEKLRTDRILENPTGRRRKFYDRWGDDLFRMAYDFIPQSTVADIINERGLIYIYNNFKEVELLNQVHDSIVFQVSLNVTVERHFEILMKIKENLEIELEWKSRKFEIPVKEGEIGKNLKDMKKFNFNFEDFKKAYNNLQEAME